MKFRDLFKRNAENATTGDVSSNENIPKVIIEDLDLQASIGKWLKIVPAPRKTFGYWLTHELLNLNFPRKKVGISSKEREQILKKFGLLLKSIGIDNEETCTLTSVDGSHYVLNCHFNNTNEDATISFGWGLDFTFKYQNVTKNYFYSVLGDEILLSLHRTINKDVNGNTCYTEFTSSGKVMRIDSQEYSLYITIRKPESVEYTSFCSYAFKLENEEELESYLLELSFPIKIDEVWKKMCELSLGDVKDYPGITLIVEKKSRTTEKETTDEIVLEHGKVTKFIMTKDDKIFELDGQDNWTYSSPELSVRKKMVEVIDYSFHFSSEDAKDSLSPKEHVKLVEQEVEEVKKLTKTLVPSETVSKD